MTKKQFNNTNFACGMVFRYKKRIYRIASCDFFTRKIGLDVRKGIKWVACQDVILIK